MEINGRTSYRGYTAQQHDDFIEVFKEFITEVRPSQILEIGTAGGGFILFIRDVLNEIGLTDAKIKTFDVFEHKWYGTLRSYNIEILVENIFTHSYKELLYPEKIESFIHREGTTVVFCDGGHKIGEFNSIAPLLKSGDFILAHDYVDTQENFIQNYKNKIWNWCEIREEHIADVSNKYGLVYYKKEDFDKVVWVCKRKNNI
jgi:cephalosporin hydroxylase